MVDKHKGLYTCFNPACGESGKLVDLVKKLGGMNYLQAEMFIAKNKDSAPVAKRREIHQTKIEEFSQDKLDELYENFKSAPRAREYMHSRGFTDETLDYFQIGYSPARILKSGKYRKEMVTVPMHDHKGMPIGLIGRVPSKEDKTFKNSRGLPKRLTAWNIHRARKAGGTVIIVEASFDAMRVHQAGYPNVIALLGGHVTDEHIEQIERYFNRVIIMTDFDWLQHEGSCRKCGGACRGHRPGRDLGRSIAGRLRNTRVLWAAYDDSCVYPHGAKDPGDMTDDEIRQSLKNAISNTQYRRWNIETVA